MSIWTAFMLLLMIVGFYFCMSVYMIWRLASHLLVRRVVSDSTLPAEPPL